MHTSHDIGCDRIAGRCLGNTKVHDLDLSVSGNHNILWLDIAVDNMIVVSCLNTHGNLNGNTDRFLDGKTGFFLNILFECDTLNQFHDDIVDTVFLSDIINTDNIGMHQSCCGLCLHTEFGNKIGVFRKLLF